jgi:hypothetical protein
MSRLKLTNTYHPVGIVLIGLLIAQILATIQVYLSNIDLHATLTAVDSAGYLSIPNKQAMGSLQEFRPAFFGGLFFSATIGAGISIGAMAAAWLWTRAFSSPKSILLIFVMIWAAILVLINSRGFNLIPTLYFLVIAPVVFALTAKRVSGSDLRTDRLRRLVHLIPVPLLAVLWFTQFDSGLFLDLRDNLLLSNPYGKKFSKFYYSYTLYPAETFKALNQKTIKTVSINNIPNRSLNYRLSQRLLAQNYLPLSTGGVDLMIDQEDDLLVLKSDGRRVMTITVDQFFADSAGVLRRFSEAVDPHAIFRQFTFLSLLVGFPVLIYMVLHAVFYYVGIYFLGQKSASLVSSVICLLIGVGVLLFFHANRSSSIHIQDIPAALQSDHWQTRVAALKMIQQHKLDIADYPAYPRLLNSSIPQERYWFVRTLAFSSTPKTYSDLLKFMDDENMNVRTMAFYALGLRKNPQAIKPILNHIEKSADWYCQLYAYKALRSLGWKQKRSL